MTESLRTSNHPNGMARSIPWLRVLVEGVVIIVSVLLALGADAWWQGRLEREEEDALLRSLHAEISLNLDRLAQWDSIESRSGYLATELLNLTGPNAESIDPVGFDSLLFEALTFRVYHPSTGSINAALRQLNVISSDELRQEIAGFEERLGDFSENFEWALEEGEAVVQHVQDRVPMFTSDNVAWAEADPGPPRRDILREVEFANLIGARLWRNGRMTVESEDFRDYLIRMLGLIGSSGFD
jgi:hypothetical protein